MPKGHTQRPAHKQDEGAEAAHSLTSVAVLGKAHPGLDLPLLFHEYFGVWLLGFDSKNLLLTTGNKNRTNKSLLVFFKLPKHKDFVFFTDIEDKILELDISLKTRHPLQMSYYQNLLSF